VLQAGRQPPAQGLDLDLDLGEEVFFFESCCQARRVCWTRRAMN
jgi:hypothetical protein